MANTAIIIAGGVGSRMHYDIPKQFVNVNDKPIIIYTLAAFQKHPDIDAIEVVCLEGWHDILKAYAKQFGITKLRWVINGGNSAQESIRNGVFNLEGKCEPEDIVIIHDGIRPLVDEISTTRYIPRETLRRVSTPQAYKFSLLDEKYHEAFDKGIGIHGSSYTNTMMADLGVRLYFAAGSDKNIKLTTQDDLELFKSFVKKEGDSLYGLQ